MRPVWPWAGSREAIAFPEFYAQPIGALGEGRVARSVQLVCTSPITYQGHAALHQDLANLKAALADSGAVQAFVPSISAVDIVDAGFVLQIDDPTVGVVRDPANNKLIEFPGHTLPNRGAMSAVGAAKKG